MQTADRSLRSVFVGNIPYDATDEKLRDIFSAVGPVLSFRIVFDRDTGKPKGYGFCEYQDKDTATSAIRNLNGYELGGRQLRVDSAANERAREEPETPGQHSAQPVIEPVVDPQKFIANLLRNLQPEQLFDICKQMKSSLMINPNESRQMLIENPQLTYALLQTLVMIKAIDAQTAMGTLHPQLMQPSLPMLTPMGPPMGAPMGPPIGAPGVVPGQIVIQSQQIPPATNPMVIQQHSMSPYAFMNPNNIMVTANSSGQPTVPPQPQPQQQPQMTPVNVGPISTAPSAAPADPRLARKQHNFIQRDF